MAAQRIKVTWEFDIDDSDTAAVLKNQLQGVTNVIASSVATTPGTRITRIEVVMPKRITTTHPRSPWETP
jgi:hypothetical protein